MSAPNPAEIETMIKRIKRKELKMNENYLMLNGKRVDLTDEQIEKLGLKDKDYFKKVSAGNHYYVINVVGTLSQIQECNDELSENTYSVANYCTDKNIMQQRALHETLSRLLWRFSMQNEGENIDWNPVSDHCRKKYTINYDEYSKNFKISTVEHCHLQGAIFFYSEKITQKAIDEIVLPFMKEHSEFIW